MSSPGRGDGMGGTRVHDEFISLRGVWHLWLHVYHSVHCYYCGIMQRMCNGAERTAGVLHALQLQEFAEDVRQHWLNVKLYNPQGDPFRKIGEKRSTLMAFFCSHAHAWWPPFAHMPMLGGLLLLTCSRLVASFCSNAHAWWPPFAHMLTL
eukprot:1149012-Pelagomonas_calceolata.AAC.8